MPNIKDDSTVEVIARLFTGECKRNITKTLIKVGYSEKYADRQGYKLLGNIGVRAAIARIDAESVKKAKLSIAEVLSDLEWGIVKAREKEDLPALARLSELRGKYLAMFTDVHRDETQQPAPLSDADRAELKRLSGIQLKTGS